MKKKIAIIVSTPMTIRAFLQDQIKALAMKYDVTLIFNGVDDFNDLGAEIKSLNIGIQRKVSLFADFKALVSLVKIFRKEKFNAVHSVTPKAGLLSMTAARIVRIKVRIHTFTGQVWATKTGVARFILKRVDCFFASQATNLFVDSRSQQDFLISEKVVKANKSQVLADGSISGVDLNKFSPDGNEHDRIRRELGIKKEEILFLFLGRLNRDKGVRDLAQAFVGLRQSISGVKLLFVGPDETGMRELIEKICLKYKKEVLFIDYTEQPESYMAAADVFCLPSYREGFGSVIIEAAATGIPSLASRIYGITDAVTEGKTGLLHEPGEINEIKKKMRTMALDHHQRKTFGNNAYERAHSHFSKARLTNALIECYSELLKD